mmetsp:Transcript_57604/g.136966  ORF Transcript_57604/g.136966 Transcript_57604/m.136966 type:complete len:418 (-) Transcript_57604:160-1413(-)
MAAETEPQALVDRATASSFLAGSLVPLEPCSPETCAEPSPAAAADRSERLESYVRKLAAVQMAPCAHIAATTNPDVRYTSGCSNSFPLLEHHAILDLTRGEAIHYTAPGDEEGSAPTRVIAEPLDSFQRKFQTWRVVALPESRQKAEEALERARSRIGEEEYNIVTNNCEHFATWCLGGSGRSMQVWSHGANLATSAKAGVGAGIAAATATTTVTTPWYFLGVIPWGTATSTVPLMGTAAAVGVGAGVFALSVGVGMTMSYGMYSWVSSSNAALAESLRIAVFNESSEQIEVYLQNAGAPLSDYVDDFKALCGVGLRKLELGSGIAGELSPPADESYLTFTVIVMRVESSEASWWPVKTQVASCIAERGDVLIYRGVKAGIHKVPDVGAEQLQQLTAPTSSSEQLTDESLAPASGQS